ncbi:hypothetical protein SARC_06952 [Sphaeroforma arctica JP610]|uniref:Phospholipid/glycerol acyltransferase domain-containing protein n=1 Tax=Sphaeroforma arctica JP610 TaxID=667725 RepID=A0A0L0FXL4_9EUKA|nr:hypothetical protein SARC_06952 [Sphaeroforma arctica JP610]KNC80703.1 hypothetical protein SARC_06952 [Sphaeroforma arctica JP610]|eukprot:XP_014154605.1 hypothetical protein SARC_06952 [Sphaeroforma arctica JP610]
MGEHLLRSSRAIVKLLLSTSPARFLRNVVPLGTAFIMAPPFLITACAVKCIVRPFSAEWAAAADEIQFRTYMTYVTTFYEAVSNAKVVWHGEDVTQLNDKHVLLICNHQSTMDWVLVSSLAIRQSQSALGSLRYVMKAGCRYIPLYGLYLYMHGCPFVWRDWRVDEKCLQQSAEWLCAVNRPLWLALFPEGTRYNASRHKQSVDYCEDHSLPPLRHVLAPRVRGFEKTLREIVRHKPDLVIYDVTYAYTPCPSALTSHDKRSLITHPQSSTCACVHTNTCECMCVHTDTLTHLCACSCAHACDNIRQERVVCRGQGRARVKSPEAEAYSFLTATPHKPLYRDTRSMRSTDTQQSGTQPRSQKIPHTHAHFSPNMFVFLGGACSQVDVRVKRIPVSAVPLSAESSSKSPNVCELWLHNLFVEKDEWMDRILYNHSKHSNHTRDDSKTQRPNLPRGHNRTHNTERNSTQNSDVLEHTDQIVHEDPLQFHEGAQVQVSSNTTESSTRVHSSSFSIKHCVQQECKKRGVNSLESGQEGGDHKGKESGSQIMDVSIGDNNGAINHVSTHGIPGIAGTASTIALFGFCLTPYIVLPQFTSVALFCASTVLSVTLSTVLITKPAV